MLTLALPVHCVRHPSARPGARAGPDEGVSGEPGIVTPCAASCDAPRSASPCAAVFTQQRSTSATLHACATQPRGVNGGSASKISLIDADARLVQMRDEAGQEAARARRRRRDAR